jgi:hypothetical protein
MAGFWESFNAAQYGAAQLAEADQRRRANLANMARQQHQDWLQTQLYGALGNAGSALLPGLRPLPPGMSGWSPMMPQSNGQPMGYGGGPSYAPPLPQVPDATAQMGALIGTPAQPGLIPRDESGGRNIANYRFDPTHTSSGPLQINNSTWNRYAGGVGAPQLRYPASPMDRPLDEQYRVGGAIYRNEGAAPWSNYNPRLAADLKNLAPEHREAASQGAMTAAAIMPPTAIGQAGPSFFAPLLERILGSGVSDEVKGAAMVRLLPLMSEEGRQQFQQQWEQYKFAAGQQEKGREFDIRQQEVAANREATRAYREESLDLRRQQLGQGQQRIDQKQQGAGAASSPETIETTAKGIAAYQLAPLSSYAMRSPGGQAIMSRALQINPGYRSTEYAARLSGERAFGAGQQGNTARSISVTIDHLATMQDLGEALQNNDNRTLNRLQNVLMTEFGFEGPVDFNAAKEIVGDEVAKAVIGGTNAEADRAAIHDKLNAANTPEQLLGVIRTFKKLLGGQLGGLRRQAQTVGISEEEFNKRLSPAALAELGGGAGQRGASRSASGDITFQGRTYAEEPQGAIDVPDNLKNEADGTIVGDDEAHYVKRGSRLILLLPVEGK